MYPQGYIEDFDEARTPLEGSFTVLLAKQSHDGQTHQQIIHRMRDHARNQAAGSLVQPGPEQTAPEHADEPDEAVSVRRGKDAGADHRRRHG